MLSAALSPLLLAVAACGEASTSPLPAAQPADAIASQSHERRWNAAVPFDEFLPGVVARRELWNRNWDRGVVPEVMRERARAAGRWRLLVVAIDGCSDSASTLPFVGRLVEAVPSLELRILHPDSGGRAIMESHRTPDGRAATPTLILLDDGYSEQGCWVERPSALQELWITNPDGLDDAARVNRKMAWYEADMGSETIREIVELLEAAAAGAPRCGGS
jgi:hypothetical protein